MCKRRSISLTLAAMLTARLGQVSFGQTVQIDGYCAGVLTFNNSYSAGSAIAASLPSCVDQVIITASSSGVNMPRITLTGATSGACRISLGASFDTAGNPPTLVGNDWKGLDASAIADSSFYGGINGSLNESIIVKSLYRFDALHDVNAAISATRTTSIGNVCIVEADAITNNGSVTVTSASISRVRVYGTYGSGGIAGNITATNGAAGNIFVDAGNLSGNVTAGTDISIVTVAGDLSGNLTATNGDIGNVTAAGDLTGLVRASAGKIHNIIVTGDIDVPVPGDGLSGIRSHGGANSIIGHSISS